MVAQSADMVWTYAILAGAAFGPAVLAALAMRFLRRWMRLIAAVALLAGVVIGPLGAMQANAAVSDNNDLFAAAMLVLIAIMGLSALIGFAVGGIWLYRHHRKRTRAIKAVS